MSDLDFKVMLDFKVDGPIAAETMRRIGEQLRFTEVADPVHVMVFTRDLKVLMVLAQCFLDNRAP